MDIGDFGRDMSYYREMLEESRKKDLDGIRQGEAGKDKDGQDEWDKKMKKWDEELKRIREENRREQKRLQEERLRRKRIRKKLMEKLVNWYQGKTSSLCIVSHYYEELEQMANKILILDKGRVIDYGDKDQLFRKYCGRAVIVFDALPQHQGLVKGYRKLASPAHLTALSVRDEAEELAVTKLLLDNNINYRRSNSDIEIMYSNARQKFYGEGQGDE